MTIEEIVSQYQIYNTKGELINLHESELGEELIEELKLLYRQQGSGAMALIQGRIDEINNLEKELFELKEKYRILDNRFNKIKEIANL